jgi:hypothetical protein
VVKSRDEKVTIVGRIITGRRWYTAKKCVDWFTEGFDTADLQEAKALLTALA